MTKTQRTSLRVKILWRALFWSGIFTVMIGTGVASKYGNSVVQGQTYLILGFATIILGIALMATGYRTLGSARLGKARFKKENK